MTDCFVSQLLTQVRFNDLKYYEKLSDPRGPAMTNAMFAIGWLEMREIERANVAFLKNYDNIQGPFKVKSAVMTSQ